jgi:uncharacterized iron-regulated membrane protein
MKKLTMFLSMLLVAFTASAELPFGQTWGLMAAYPSYWVGISIALVVNVVGALWIKKRVARYGWDGQVKSVIAVMLIAILFAMLAPVAEAAANSYLDESGKVILIR